MNVVIQSDRIIKLNDFTLDIGRRPAPWTASQPLDRAVS